MSVFTKDFTHIFKYFPKFQSQISSYLMKKTLILKFNVFLDNKLVLIKHIWYMFWPDTGVWPNTGADDSRPVE